ncbi:MAG: hypothetical protein ABWX90_01305 [Candidatus Saccharimonadales bacterium]
MVSKVNKTGPWILKNNPDVESLVDRLNSKLPLGVRTPVVKCDTANMPHTTNDAGYRNMSHIAPVSVMQNFGPGDAPYIHIPLGIGINIPIKPLEWNGDSYPAVIDIVGDFINISVPYLFKLTPDRVDVTTYTIITDEK